MMIKNNVLKTRNKVFDPNKYEDVTAEPATKKMTVLSVKDGVGEVGGYEEFVEWCLGTNR